MVDRDGVVVVDHERPIGSSIIDRVIVAAQTLQYVLFKGLFLSQAHSRHCVSLSSCVGCRHYMVLCGGCVEG